MSKFITGKDLEDAITDIIWQAEEALLLVSPFIKLDTYFKELFNKHRNNHKIHIILVFGKNEKAVKKSMSKEDFDYFKQFPFVSIVYVPNLHAKYYGNETKGVLTSINLYDYSFKNNIEFGMFYENSIMDRFKRTADQEAWEYCMQIAHDNEAVFIKRPVYEQKRILVNLGKNYIKSEVLHDSTEKFYSAFRRNQNTAIKYLGDFDDFIDANTNNSNKPQREDVEIPTHGFCIRTGKKIKYNPKQPMSREAWLVWNEYGNEDFPERFCHRTGQPSNGKTSMKNPIL